MEVVALVVHLRDHRRQRIGLDLCERVCIIGSAAEPDDAGGDAVLPQQELQLACGGERRLSRGVAVVPAAVDDQR